MSFFHRDSKTDLKLRSDYCIKFQTFMVAQDIFGRLMVVLFVTAPKSLQSTSALSTIRGTSLAPLVAVINDFFFA